MPIPVPGSERFAYRPSPASTIRERLPEGFPIHSLDPALVEEIDPLTYEVIRHRLWAITEEMAEALKRMSGSIVVTDCNDFNACILDECGDEVQIGLYNTQLSASIDMAVKWTLENRAENPGIADGDMFITTDPWVGGGIHQNDVSVFGAIFWEGELFGWTNAVAHQLDLGGVAPGSWTPKSRDVFWESLPMPPIKIYENGRFRSDAEDCYLRRSRVPRLLALDLRAQVGANNVGAERIRSLIAKYGPERVKAVMTRMMDDAERRLRARLRELPDGTWSAVAHQDQAREGDRGVYKIVCKMTKEEDRLVFDFRGTDPEVEGLINCTYGGMRAGIMVILLTMLCGDIPWAPGGIQRCFDIVADEGTLNNCSFPAGISKASIASSWATQSAVGECVAAMLDTHHTHRKNLLSVCCGTFDLALMSGVDQHHHPFVTLLGDAMAGGIGARVDLDGVDTGGMQNISQARIADVEMNEFAYPMLYLWRREEPDSGGPGRFRGGLGGSSAFILHDAPLQSMSVTVSSTGKAVPQAPGIAGGYPGNTTHDLVIRRSSVREQLSRGSIPAELDEIEGDLEPMPPELDTGLQWDDVYYMNWPGGGGYGDPLLRDPELVVRDLSEAKVTRSAARDVYGVVLDEDGSLDLDATEARRLELRRGRGDGADAEGGEGPVGAEPVRPGTVDGKQFDDNVVVDAAGDSRCAHCGTLVGRNSGPFLGEAHERLGDPSLGGPQIRGNPGEFVDAKIVFRQLCCPTCMTALLTEIVPASETGVRSKALGTVSVAAGDDA
jgi:N-methylhydantoinase B